MPTKIEWTEETWNPFVGCSRVSAGCANCYAIRQAARCEGFGLNAYAGITRRNGDLNWSGRINRGSDATWEKPLKLHPSMIFVNSMSDFWHPSVPDEWRREAIDIMWLCPEHKFQVRNGAEFNLPLRLGFLHRQYLTHRGSIQNHFISVGRFSSIVDTQYGFSSSV